MLTAEIRKTLLLMGPTGMAISSFASLDVTAIPSEVARQRWLCIIACGKENWMANECSHHFFTNDYEVRILLEKKGNVLFPFDLVLISHWRSGCW